MRVRIPPPAPPVERKQSVADFCRDCTVDMFGNDYADKNDMIREQTDLDSGYTIALCEGCGIHLFHGDSGKRFCTDTTTIITTCPQCEDKWETMLEEAGIHDNSAQVENAESES